jgi:DNA-binding response OmpR family regulator
MTRALDCGADEFMAKPIGVETIVYKMIMLLTTKYAQHLIMIVFNAFRLALKFF